MTRPTESDCALFAQVVASSHDAIITRTLDGIVTSWNSGAECLFGYSASEMVGQTMNKVFPADRLDEEGGLLQRVAHGERLGRQECLRLRKDGSMVHVAAVLSPIHDGDGRMVGISTIARDISDRIERDELSAELALDAQRFVAIVESSEDAVISKSLDGIVTSWNRAAERIFGYAAWEIVGTPMIKMFPSDRLDEERQFLSRVALGERVEHFETVRLHKSGRPVDVSVSISPIRDQNGRVIGASKIARDISDKVQAERRALELMRESRVYAAIVESSDDAIISKTLDGTITSWNRAAERIFGYTAEEIIGRPMTTVIPADRLGEEIDILARLSRGERIEHFETIRLRKDGGLVNISATVSPLVDDSGRVVGASKIARDITERIEAERTIWRQANYDTLTQLPNRRYFKERLHAEIARAGRVGKHVAVLFIDLDRFKEVNDSLGHQAGDELLLQAAERIKASLRDADSVARMGGDEFTVLLSDIGGADDATPIAARLNERLFDPFVLDGLQVHISGSIGVAVYPEDGATVDELLKHADQAMYESKRLGRNQTRYFAHALDKKMRDRLQLAADLRHATARNELQLVYQPVVSLRDGSILKCEALLRWNHPTLGRINPMTFIPLAEESGLIKEIGDWVFRSAARQAKQWQARFGDHIQVGINVSPVQIHGGLGYFQNWVDELNHIGLAGSSLVVEITEGVMVDRSGDTAERLRLLQQAGVQVAIDDFGTGYSCLSYLSRLDVNFLKIDQSFTKALGADPRVLALCEAIVVMAHKLGLQVIAEGVETDAQLALLQQIGCDHAQGYLFAAPGTAAELEARFTHTPQSAQIIAFR
jgi:diguanylate cyclase (GGDEF)-like protein/PAS domain S-box-containing protein